MRIALLPSAYAPALGGVEELTRRLADRLVALGHQVEVWTFRHPADLPAEDVIDGIPVRRFAFPMPAARAGSLLRWPADAIRSNARLTQAVRSFRPEVLHVQCFSGQGVYAAAASARHRIPMVVTLQGETVMDDHDIYEHSTALRLGLRASLRQARAVTACSRFILDDTIARFGLPGDKGRVVYNGVEVAGDEHPRKMELPFEQYVFALGRVVPKKGFDLLLAAFAEIAERIPGVGLVIGGEGGSRDHLRRQAKDLGVGDRVILPGRLDRGQVAWAMANAAVFALPSRVEPFGIVVIEALRAGRAVVVSSRGGAPEIVRHGVEGLVADPFDSSAFGAALQRLLGDSVLAARLSRAGRARVDEFSWDKIAGQYDELYRSLR